MTNAIHHVNNSPSQNHQSTTIITTTTTTTTNALLIRRAKLGQFLNSSSPNDTTFLSPLLIHKKHYPNTPTTPHTPTTTTTTTTSNSSSSSGSNSPRLSSYDNNNNNNNNNQQMLSPYNLQTTPTLLSPWTSTRSHNHKHLPFLNHTHKTKHNILNHHCYLIGSLVREEGHVHSLAVKEGVLYTGSESNNIRVWNNHFNDIGCLKAGSGFVKAIVISSNVVLTAHQDGKIRVWSHDNKRIGTFPKVTDLIKTSIKQAKIVSKMKHYDAISCLGVNEELGLLYSGSWDKTIKVWRIKDGKCLESIDDAHDDAINSIVVGFGGGGGGGHNVLFSGGADGKLKMWERKEHQNNIIINNTYDRTKHVHVRTLMEQKDAVTSLVVGHDDVRGGSTVLYCGSSDGLVNFWEKVKEGVVYGGALRGHKLAVLCLGAAGCMVFSGSADKSICVWRRQNDGVHSCIAVLYGHSGPVKCLAVERDRDYNVRHNDDDDENRSRKWIVYSGSLDKSVRVWRVCEEIK